MAHFTLETVDGPGTVAGQCCLALDSNGNPWIAYAATGGKLMLASRDSGTWIREELSGAGLIGSSDSDRICLHIDSQGNPHIAYEDTTDHLFYGIKRENHWTFMPVPTRLGRLDPGDVAGYDFQLHFRQDTPELRDTPHFVFHDVSTGQLGYTRRINGEFKLVTAAVADGNTSRIGLNPSISFDHSFGAFRIAFVEVFGSDDDVDLPPLSKVWMRMILDPFEAILGEPLLLDQGNFRVVRNTSITSDIRFCVAFADSTNRTLYVSFLAEAIPDPIKQVVATTVFPIVPSVAQTSRGKYRIAYGDDNKLKLASHDREVQWVIEIVDPDGGSMPSLAYDRLSLNGHIAYSTNQALKYAKWTEQP